MLCTRSCSCGPGTKSAAPELDAEALPHQVCALCSAKSLLSAGLRVLASACPDHHEQHCASSESAGAPRWLKTRVRVEQLSAAVTLTSTAAEARAWLQQEEDKDWETKAETLLSALVSMSPCSDLPSC